MQFAHTGAWFRGPYRSATGPDPAALDAFSAVMGDWRTGEVRRFDPALLDLIWRLGQACGVGEFTCLSGYRTPATNAAVGGAQGSQHLSARAVDLWLPPRKLAEAVGKAQGMKAGGVGAYATWMHLDSGPARFWDHRPGAAGGGEAESPLAIAAPAIRQRFGLAHSRQWMLLDPLERQNRGPDPFAPAPRILNLR